MQATAFKQLLEQELPRISKFYFSRIVARVKYVYTSNKPCLQQHILMSVDLGSSLHCVVRILNSVFRCNLSPACTLYIFLLIVSAQIFIIAVTFSHFRSDWMFNCTTWIGKILLTEECLVPSFSPNLNRLWYQPRCQLHLSLFWQTSTFCIKIVTNTCMSEIDINTINFCANLEDFLHVPKPLPLRRISVDVANTRKRGTVGTLFCESFNTFLVAWPGKEYIVWTAELL